MADKYYKFKGYGNYGTQVEQTRVSDKVTPFAKVANEHILPEEKLIKVERDGLDVTDELSYKRKVLEKATLNALKRDIKSNRL